MTVINTNTAAINAQHNLSKVQSSMDEAMARLSSGKRINAAADDAAGLSIATRMESQIIGMQMTMRNANDGISLVSSVEGALQESTNILQRMYELSVQASNSTYNDTDRAALQDEIAQLQTELDRIANDTEFNGQKIADGSFTGKSLNVGFTTGGMIDINIGDHSSAGLSAAGTKDAVASLTSSASAIAVAVGTSNEIFDASTVQSAETFANDQAISREILQHNIGTDESQKVTETTVSDIVTASTATADGLTAVAAGNTEFERANQVAGVVDNQMISYNEAGSTAGADGIVQVDSWKVNGRLEHTDVLSFELDAHAGVEITVGPDHFGSDDYETKTNALNALVTKWNNNLAGENVHSDGGKVELALQFIDGDHYIVATASNSSDTAIDYSDATDGLTVTNTASGAVAGDFSAGAVTAAVGGAAANVNLTIANAGNLKVGDTYTFAITDGGSFTYTVAQDDIGSTATETLANVRSSFIDAYNNSDDNYSETSGVMTASADADNSDQIVITGTNTTAGETFVVDAAATVAATGTNDTSADVTETTDATIVAGTAVGPKATGKAADTAAKELVVDITDHDAGDVLEVSFGGYTFTHTIDEGGATDTATTVAAALVAEINDLLPNLEGAGTITATNAAGVITLTAENAGAAGDFDVSVNTRNAEAVAIQGVIDFAADDALAAGTNALAVGEEVTLSFGTNNSVTYTVTAEVAAMAIADAEKEVVKQLVALGNEQLEGVSLRVDPSATAGNQIIYESTVPGVDPGFTAAAVGNAEASARVNSFEFSGYIGQGDAFTIADGAGNTITVTATSAVQALDTNDERRTAMRELAYDALLADNTITTAYTVARDGDFGIQLTANVVATDFELTVSSTNASATKVAKIEQLTLSGSVQEGDTYSVDFGDGNLAEYTATAADVDGKSAEEALTAVRDGLMAKAAETGLVTAEAVEGDKIKLTAAVTGVDFRAVASASNAASKSQIEEVAIGNVEAGDAFSISIGDETLSYTAGAGEGAEEVAAWMAENASFSGVSVTANGSALSVEGAGGASFAMQTQTTNYAGGIQEQTMTIGGSMDRGDVYNVMLDGQVIETTVEAGDDQSAVANRIAENLNAQAGDKVVASVNDDGTIKIASAAAGVTFEAAVTVSDEGRSSETVGAIDISTEDGANAAKAVLQGAISQVNETRSELGAIQNRLDHTINNLSSVVVNTEASQSRIEDADFATETSALTKSQILSQAATAMLAQANASKQSVLSLLQG